MAEVVGPGNRPTGDCAFVGFAVAEFAPDFGAKGEAIKRGWRLRIGSGHVEERWKGRGGGVNKGIRLGGVVEGGRRFVGIVGKPDSIVIFDVEGVGLGVEPGSMGVVEKPEITGVNGLAGHDAGRDRGELASGVLDRG